MVTQLTQLLPFRNQQRTLVVVLAAGLLYSVSLVTHADVDLALEQSQNRERDNLNQLVLALRNSANVGGSTTTLLDQLQNSGNPDSTLVALRSLLPAQYATHLQRQNVTQHYPRRHRARQTGSSTLPRAVNTSLNRGTSHTREDKHTHGRIHSGGRALSDWWVSGWHTDTEQQADRALDAYEASEQGIATGLEFTGSSPLAWGVFLRMSNANIDAGQNGKDTIDNLEAGLSLSWHTGRHLLFSQFAYGEQDTRRTRPLLVPGMMPGDVPMLLRSDINSDQLSISAGYAFDISNTAPAGLNWSLSPSISVTYTQLSTDDYLERATDTLALEVATDKTTQTLLDLGLQYSVMWFAGDWLVLPYVSATWSHEFSPEPISTTASFGDRRFVFDTEGYEIDENQLRYGLGINLMSQSNVTIGLAWTTMQQDDFELNSFDLELNIPL